MGVLSLELPDVESLADLRYPPRSLRRSWTHGELLATFPSSGVRVLDVGAGDMPLRVRTQDELVTVDFDAGADPSVVADVAAEWPFGEREFDLVYMSHVVEHFYPPDRDRVIGFVHRSLRPGGFLFIRVPHWSGMQGFGWEHHSYYGLNGVTSLSHGRNPNLPLFRAASAGVSMTTVFDGPRTPGRAFVERLLNWRWQLTERFLARWIGGIPEVQFLLQRLPSDLEARLKRGGHLPGTRTPDTKACE